MDTQRPRLSRHDQSSNAVYYLLAVVVLVGGAAAGYLMQMSRRSSNPGTEMPTSGFDINYLPSAPGGQAPEPPRAAASPRPVGAGALPQAAAMAKPPAPAPAAPRRPPVDANPHWISMLTNPAKFFVSGTNLKSSAALRGFLADRKRVDYWATHPVVKEVLGSALLIKLLVRPATARAFIATPAMNDDAAVTALARSPLVGQILRAPGVQEALADPSRINSLIADPQVLRWLGEHPAAIQALGQANPSMAALSALGARPR